jgi:hypothetical protein
MTQQLWSNVLSTEAEMMIDAAEIQAGDVRAVVSAAAEWLISSAPV